MNALIFASLASFLELFFAVQVEVLGRESELSAVVDLQFVDGGVETGGTRPSGGSTMNAERVSPFTTV